MPSNALLEWQADRRPRLAAVEAACAAATAPTLADELLRGYVMLLSAQLQGFCRELYDEGVLHVTVHAPTVPMMRFVDSTATVGQELINRNPNWRAIRRDFDRFGFSTGDALAAADPAGHAHRVTDLDRLNLWRNHAAHHTRVPPAGGPLTLPLVHGWAVSCDELAAELDRALYNQLSVLLGVAPWTP